MRAKDVAREALEDGGTESANMAMLVSIADSLERIADSLDAMTTATVAKAKSAP